MLGHRLEFSRLNVPSTDLWNVFSSFTIAIIWGKMNTAPSRDVVATFYDANISGKLEGFVEGNPRVERAWETIDN